jgi:nucleoside-diphosphate-sugar epimerase
MNSSDFTVTFLRNATCYGVSPRMRFDMVLNNLVGYAFTEGKVKILSDGTAWRPLVHVEDVAQAFILAMEAPKADVAAQTFSVGSENFQVSQIAEIVKKTVPNSVIEYAPGGQKDFRSYNVSFSKIEKMLGFKPKWNAEKGAKELYEAYKEFGLTKESFQDKKFWAGKYFKFLIDSGTVNNDLRIKQKSF